MQIWPQLISRKKKSLILTKALFTNLSFVISRKNGHIFSLFKNFKFHDSLTISKFKIQNYFLQGDDDVNIEEDFVRWKEAFWTSVCEEFTLESLGDDFSMRQYEATVLNEGDYKPERVYSGEVARIRSYQTQRPPFDVKNPFLAPVKVNRNLHSEKSDR